VADLLKPDPRVLVIDSDKSIRRLLRAVLEPHGYQVFEAQSGSTGLSQAVECRPEVIILELQLADAEGVEVLLTLREWNQAPVLVLSERTDDASKVAALDAGANDYLTKPFSSAELLARLRVLLRPLPNVPEGPFLVEEELVVNLSTHATTWRGQPLELTPKEEALFYVLARYAGKVVTRDHLLRSVWGAPSGAKKHDLLVLVGQLRKKLEPFGSELLIQTEGSLGYCLTLRDQPPSHNSRLSAASGETESAQASH
jgi:two-component system, OmpR family, KDP operon response regulator KdpE